MKKMSIVLLIMMFCLALIFSGCNTDKSNSTDGKTTTTEDKSSATEEKTGTEEGQESSSAIQENGYTLSEPGTFPIVLGDEPAELTVFYVPHTGVLDMETNYATLWLEEKTNVHIDWMLASSADSEQKLSTLLATNDTANMPDVFLASVSRPVAEAYGAQGILLDISSYIDDYGVNTKALFGQNDKLESQMTAYDGGKYFLFRYYETVHMRHIQRMWMNMQWLENLGLNAPETTDDFYNVLKAFKEGDANGNGDTEDEIPFIYYQGGWTTTFGVGVMNSFVYYPTDSLKLYAEDGTVKVSYAQDGWREGLKYFKKLYDDELLDNECFSMTVETAKALGADENGNRVGTFVGGVISNFSHDSEAIHEFDIISPLEGPTGLRQAARDLFNPNPYYVISATSDTPIIAFRWGDTQSYNSVDDIIAGDYTWLNFWYGEQGVGWELSEEGAVGFTGEPSVYKWLFSWGEDQNTHWYEDFIINMPEQWKNIIEADMSAAYPQEKILYEGTVQKNAPYAVDKTLPTYSFDEDTSIELAELATNLQAYYEKMQADFVTGVADIYDDAVWADYLAQLDTIGLQRYLEVYQSAYDR